MKDKNKTKEQLHKELAKLRQQIANLEASETERKQAKKVLRESEESFKTMMEQSPYGIQIMTPDGRIVQVNDAYVELWGVALEDVSKYNILQDEQARSLGLMPYIERAFAGEALSLPPFEYDPWKTMKKGRKRWIQSNIYPVKDDNGQIRNVIMMHEDITERKQAEERIKHLSLVLRAIRDVNQLITREKDRDNLLKTACESLIATRGYYNVWIALLDESGKLLTSAEAGLGKAFLPIIEQLNRGDLTVCAQKALRQQEVVVTKDTLSDCNKCPLSKEYSGRGGMAVRLEYDKKVYGLLTTSVPLDFIFEEEEQSLFQEVARDIAFALHSLELEEERKQMQERLMRQEKLAVLGQLAGGVGHELRNPLGAIKNAAYFLNMALEKPEPEVKETLEILEKEVGNSERIISSLLDFASPKPPTRRKVDINGVVQESLSRVSVPENVEVVRQLDRTLPVILSDPDQLGQVFVNIILNATQALPEGGKLVVKSEVASAECLTVSFTDTGAGIPKENIDKLFEPLFTTKAKGIGLGLAVVKTLVEGQGGTIEVKSEVSKGSTFTVKLPVSGKEEK